MEKTAKRRVALILGAGDIGSATAWELARGELDLVLVDCRRERLKEVADAIDRETGRCPHIAVADLKQEQAGPAVVAEAINHFGQLDVMVTAAAQTRDGTILDLSLADWTDGFAAMFFGAVNVVRAAWPHLAAARGHLVMISGIAAIRPRAESALPSVLAAAVLNFTKLAAELGMRDGVSVNSVLPGPVAGRRIQERYEAAARERGISVKEVAAAHVRALGVERLTRPDEIAKLIAFLTSEAAGQIRGASLVIDGGLLRAL